MSLSARPPLILALTGISAVLLVATPASAVECFNVYANKGWQPYELRQQYPGRTSIQVSGEWSVNPEKYAPVNPLSGHFDPDLERKYARYKYDSRYPFGVLLFSVNGQSPERLASFTNLPRQGWLRINDSDASSWNNAGVARVCVFPG